MSKKEKTPSKSINFLPKPQHFLVEAESSTKTASGIIIPDSAKDMVAQVLFSRPQKVLCVGPKCEFVEAGDWVLLEPSPVDLTEVDDNGYFIIAEYRVRGKVLNYTPKEIEKIVVSKRPDIIS